MKTVTEQIAWIEKQLKVMDTAIPAAVRDGRLSPEHAEDKLACARAILQTLTQLRCIVRGDGAST